QHATFSPDEQWIATGSTDRSVRLWRAVDPEFAVHFGQTNCVRAMAFAPDGSTLLVGSADGVVHEYGAEKRQLRAGVGTTGINRIAFSPRCTSIAVAHVDHTFTLWPNRRADPVRIAWPGKLGTIGIPAWRNVTLAFLDETHLLAGAQDGCVGFFGIDGELQRELPRVVDEDEREIPDLALHPDRRHFATGHRNGRVAIRSLDGTAVTMKEPGQPHKHAVVSVQFSPDGSLLLTGSADKTAVLWRWTGDELRQLATLSHQAAVTSASFAPDGSTVLTTTKDGTAHLWDLAGERIMAIRASSRALSCGVWSPDSQCIATGDDQGIVRTWPVRRERILELARDRS